MEKSHKGFTLIELLIVIAIIGILSALLIPNTLSSIQKAKQKQTMKDIIGIATACADYITSTGYAPDPGNQSGPISASSDFITEIAPTFIKACPVLDQWGHAFQVYTGTAVANGFGIPADGLGDDDFLIVSYGRDGEVGGTISFTFQESNPIAGMYTVRSMADFNNDLVNMNGIWLHAPLIAAKGS